MRHCPHLPRAWQGQKSGSVHSAVFFWPQCLWMQWPLHICPLSTHSFSPGNGTSISPWELCALLWAVLPGLLISSAQLPQLRDGTQDQRQASLTLWFLSGSTWGRKVAWDRASLLKQQELTFSSDRLDSWSHLLCYLSPSYCSRQKW